MDCQFIMGTLAFMYYQGFISVHKASVGGVIEAAITGLTLEEQMDVILRLSKHLVNQGALPSSVSCPDQSDGVLTTQVWEYIGNQNLTLKRR
jgi:phosphatidate cytidylyltransferase